MNMIYIFLLLLALPHCGGSIQPKKTFHPVQKEIKERTTHTPHWQYNRHMPLRELSYAQGITSEQAIALGINNNSLLQAAFDEIGIAKADLEQAGFYSNPHLETIFRIPRQTGDQTNIELSLTFKLSDVWQVPLRKKVAKDELERKTFEIIDMILRLRADIQKQCATIIYHTHIQEITKDITDQLIAFRNTIYERYQFGYASDLDKDIADMKVGIWQAKIIDANAMLEQSYISLYELMGVSITNNPITILTQPPLSPISISLDELETYALTTHPRIRMEQAAIAQAQHRISYERSRIFDDVQIGLAYERELEKGKSGIGPSISLNIPFFNLNYGAIEHAKFEKQQAEKLLISHQRELHTQLLMHYTQYNSYLKQVAQYETSVLPAAAQAIAYTKTFSDRMQLNTLFLLDAEISFYEQKMNIAELTHLAIMHYADLEQAVGSSLAQLPLQEGA